MMMDSDNKDKTVSWPAYPYYENLYYAKDRLCIEREQISITYYFEL